MSLLGAVEGALAAWSGSSVSEWHATPLTGGHSNLTFKLEGPAGTYVLRRPPRGEIAPRTHDVAREFRVMDALGGTGFPVPGVHWLCDDPGLLGCPFYVMDHVPGLIPRTVDDLAALGPRERAVVSRSVVELMATLHSVDADVLVDRRLGRRVGYVERQLARWRTAWSGVEGALGSEATELCRRVERILGESARAGDGEAVVVHGDMKLDNVVFSEVAKGEVAAVLDWEMATVGDPLADLAILMAYWGASARVALNDEAAASSAPDLWAPERLAGHYAEVTGRSTELLDAHRVLAYLKLGAIALEIARRDPASGIDNARPMVDLAWAIADASDLAALCRG